MNSVRFYFCVIFCFFPLPTAASIKSTVEIFSSECPTKSEVKSKKSNLFSRFSVRKTGLCRVKLLDGSEREIEVKKRAKGHDLFEKICSEANLREKYYFGLSICSQDKTKVWLDLNKKIKKQMKNEPWNFSFEVKFYPTNPEELQDEYTRYLMCLQIRNDIFSEKLRCTPHMLASYLVQSRFGDYDSEIHGENYLSEFALVPNQNKIDEIKIMELHKQHKGQTPVEAELNYLRIAKKLKMYGVNLFEVNDWRNFNTMIGVCPSGLQVYFPGKSKLRFRRYEWASILEITSRKNKFCFELRKDGEALPPSVFQFTLPDDEGAKRLWKTCIEYYTFYKLKLPKSIPKTRRYLFRRKIHKKYRGPTECKLREKYALEKD